MCIAKKILHWTKSQINAPKNGQWLSRICHKEKDLTTPARYMANLRQQHGGEVTLEEVQEWASKSKYNKNGR
jgi:hypothetical protein